MAHESKLPYFLTSALIVENDVIRKTLDLVSSLKDVLHKNCHITIIVPKLIDCGRQEVSLPLCKIEPHILHEYSVGKDTWEYELDKIACSKAMQLWSGFADGELRVRAHLLFEGDTWWVGGVQREGIVVACSGFEECFDRMVASIVADICIALAKYQYENRPGKNEGSDWIGRAR